MKVVLEPGKYVLAVSGGVDSMVLLDLLTKQPDIELVIGHFNHGIRKEAAKDEEFVRQKAAEYGIRFEAGHGNLGPNTSEEAARNARYKFLNAVRHKYGAKAVITAHHQDDLIETALLNLLRGTGRKGMVAMQSNTKILRPLLNYSKPQIKTYAKVSKLSWREDSTNQSDVYLRNYLRNKIISNLNGYNRDNILKNIDNIAKTDKYIDVLIANLSQIILSDKEISRISFASLPVNLGDELMAYWLRQRKIGQFDQKTVNRLCVALKTAKPNTSHSVQGEHQLVVGAKTAYFA